MLPQNNDKKFRKMKIKSPFTFSLLVVAVVFIGCTEQRSASEEVSARPNIIFIIADDMGYGDIGAFGQKIIQTPNLDSIAAIGTKFTHFYAGNTVCAPSRYALMTGSHMGNAYVRGNDPDKTVRFGSGVPLRKEDLTIAKILKDAGYNTAMFGKWGLGVEETTGEPQLHGWDEFYGYLNQADAHKYYFDHLWQSNKDSLWKVAISDQDYTHDLIMDKAFSFLEKQESKSPFFLYIPMAPPHAELLLPEKYMEPYLDKDGKSKFQEEPFEGDNNYRPQENPKAAYAGMVTKIDADFGRIVNKLGNLGMLENTLIIFTSDNGPHAEGGYNPEYFDSNGNLRGFKRDLYEGGIRVPTIAYWKGKTLAKTIDEPYAFWDVFPTFSEIGGASSPQNIDGISFASVLRGQEPQNKHDYLYWEFHIGGDAKFSQAVLEFPWKAHRSRKSSSDPVVLELYNIEEDPSESNDLSDKNKEILTKLISVMDSVSTKPEHPDFAYSGDFFEAGK